MPLGAIILVVAIFIGGITLLWASLHADRKKNVRLRQSSDSDWIGRGGRCTSCVSVDVSKALEKSTADNFSVSAIRSIGGVDIHVHESAIEGWTEVAPLTGWFFGWAPQQLGIHHYLSSTGFTRFDCCSRPRFAMALSDVGRNRRVAMLLAEAISTLTTNSDVPPLDKKVL
jgi:hypothetical protein